MIDNEHDDIILNDVWKFYFHDPYDSNWNYNSYKQLCMISSVKEFWELNSLVHEKIHCGMFFLNREDVFPCWDDENNIKGGCLSLKVLKQDVHAFWDDISMKLLGETLLKDEFMNHWNLVNGISISPKKFFCIIKIWVKSNNLNSKDMFNLPENYNGEIIYRSNQENIDENHNKLKQNGV